MSQTEITNAPDLHPQRAFITAALENITSKYANHIGLSVADIYWINNAIESLRESPDLPTTNLEQVEREHVLKVLAMSNENRSHAAKALGISIRTLQRKLKAWGIQDRLPLGAK